MQGKYPIITMCGSTKFFDTFISEMARLTLEGNIVIIPGAYGHHDPSLNITDDDKRMLDDLHKRKLDMSDLAYFVNVGGYMGESTLSELAYCKEHGIPYEFLEEPKEQ